MSDFLMIDDDIMINERFVRWVKKVDECMLVCDKLYGCNSVGGTYKICKATHPKNYDVWERKYNELNKHTK
jgi:hypothetical protein